MIPEPDDATPSAADGPGAETGAPQAGPPIPSIDGLLRATPLLAGLDRASQDSLVWRFQALPFKVGDTLIRAGSQDSELVVILDGFAEVYARAGDRRYMVAVLDPGSVVGEASFFDPAKFQSADVVGATSGMAAVLHRAVYDELLVEQQPAAAALERVVLQAVSMRMQYTTETLAELLDTHKSGELLTSLARMFGKEDAP